MIDKRRFDDAGTRTVTEDEQIRYTAEPRHKWVLVRKTKAEEKKTSSGIVIPGADFFINPGYQSQLGEIVFVPETVKDLKAGDLVLYTQFAQTFPDLEKLTGDPNLELVRDEEIFVNIKPKQ
jgi:co-chaperonin GroES (HSP10)